MPNKDKTMAYMVDPNLPPNMQPQAFSYDVPQQANMMGNAKPVFNEQTQGMAQTAFGSGFERQMSMPNSGSVTQMKSPLEGNAFIGAKMAAEKAGESTFEVDGKTFNVK